MQGTSSRTLLLTLALAPLLTLGGCAGVSGGLDKTYKNSIGMEFVPIPAGTFLMGCTSEAEECWEDEKPRHEVTISRPFHLGKYEVTQAQWQAVMGNNPSDYKGADRPVENVSWDDAQEFIRKLNEKEGIPATACPRRRNGSTRPGRGARRRTVSATTRTNRGTTPGIVTIAGKGPLRWVRGCRTRGACLTCTATCGSGFTIGTAVSITAPRP